MNEGFILLHRKIKDNWLWQRSDYFHWFCHLLLKANFKDNDKCLFNGKFISVKRGQFITSYQNLSMELPDASIRKIRTFLELLKNDSIIDTDNIVKATRITICNYDSYQGVRHDSDKQNDNQTTTKRHDEGNQTTTIEIKKKKEEKENKEKKGITKKHLFKNSPYFDLEYFKSEIDVKYQKFDLNHYHENAVNYSESKGAMYVNWLAAIRNWILRDDKEGKAKSTSQKQSPAKISDEEKYSQENLQF